MTKITISVALTPEIRAACGEVYKLKRPRLPDLQAFCRTACEMGIESAVEITAAGDNWRGLHEKAVQISGS